MEIRLLKYFLAVAREESITAAAQSLHISQPNLSRQLRELEEELGKTLFHRSSRRIELTEEGHLLRKRAEEILNLVQRTEKEITSSESLIAGDVFIGAGETSDVRYLADAMCTVRTRYPDVHFHISSGDDKDVLYELDNGLIDFGLILTSFNIDKYDYIRLPGRNSWGVLMRSDAPLANKELITSEDLRNQPLILSRRALGSSILVEWVGPSWNQGQVAATYSLLYNASLMVEAGMGYAICLNGIINTTGDSKLCFRPLKTEHTLSTNVIWKKQSLFSKASEIFLNELKSVCYQEADCKF